MRVASRNRARKCLACLAAFLAGAVLAIGIPPGAAHADTVSVINAMRTEGCGSEPAAGTRVLPNLELDDVALELSRGENLEEAVDRVGYPAASSSSFHVTGTVEDHLVRQILADRFCASINHPRYDEIGVFRRGDETWIVLDVRRVVPPPLDPVLVAARVLELVNAARAEGRTCGRDRYEAAPPLESSALLDQVALGHARDMAERGRLGHDGSDGSRAGDRITRAGYRWRASGENVASGQRDADAAVAAWLGSPGHCATLMGPYFTEMGIAFALAPERNPPIYWAQVFAAPR